MACKIGTITIGQSPRTDVLPEIKELLGDVIIEERGALDGLSVEEIQKFAPSESDYMLVTRLRDGHSVQIAEKYILERMQAHIDSLCRQGADGILLLCTGEFPAFACAKPLLYPQRLLQYFVTGAVSDQRVGILTPAPGQIQQAIVRWTQNGQKDILVEAANPYAGEAPVTHASLALKQQGAQLIVMDCIGYTCTMKNAVAKLTGLPVVLPRTVAARAVAELFG